MPHTPAEHIRLDAEVMVNVDCQWLSLHMTTILSNNDFQVTCGSYIKCRTVECFFDSIIQSTKEEVWMSFTKAEAKAQHRHTHVSKKSDYVSHFQLQSHLSIHPTSYTCTVYLYLLLNTTARHSHW